MGFRFIHTADLHLDSPFKGLHNIPAAIRERITDSTMNAFQGLVQYAIEHQVDFVLFAGDIFDQENRSLKAQLAFRKGLQSLSDHRITSYIVHGNHDPLHASFEELQCPENVYIFSSERVERRTYSKAGEPVADIFGISYLQRKETRNLAQEFPTTVNNTFSIGLLHTNCGGNQEHGHYAPCTLSDLLASAIDYWALGHVHTSQVLHEHPYVVYPGCIQGRHRNESGKKGFYDVAVNERNDVSLCFIPVSALEWQEMEVDLSQCQYIDQVFDLIAERSDQLRQETNHSCIVRIKGIGQTELAQKLKSKEVRASLIQEWQELETKRMSAETNFVWVDSFVFEGPSIYDREELRKEEPMMDELFYWMEQLQETLSLRQGVGQQGKVQSEGQLGKGQQEQLQGWIEEALGELWDHHRLRKLLHPLTKEEWQECIQEAEQRMIEAWMEGGKR